MKRVLDILVAVIIIVIFLPVGLIVALVLRFTGEGETFYRQQRIGYRERPFGLIKFATMLKNSQHIGAGDITVANDPRVLPAGRVLRKTKLNEVPQLLNIVAGDMSFVGPRPLTPKNFDYYSADAKDIITRMRPGLTGIGSIVFRDEESIIGASPKDHEQCYREDIAPYKASLEEWYFEHRSIVTDLLVIFVTAWVVVFPASRVYRRIWPSLPTPPEYLDSKTNQNTGPRK